MCVTGCRSALQIHNLRANDSRDPALLETILSRLHWLDAFSYATSGLMQFILTFIVLITFCASIIYALRDLGWLVPNINPIINLLMKLGLAVIFALVLTEIARSTFSVLITITGLDPYAAYSPFR